MGTIRRLTSDDYDAICQVVDSRPYFQGRPVDQSWIDKFKNLYVKGRLSIPMVYFLGYFNDDGELIAFRSGHQTLFMGHFALGVSYTKKGKSSERYPGTNWPLASIELNHAMLDVAYDCGATSVWLVAPAIPPKAGRLIEAPGTRLTDSTKFKREEDIPVKAGTLTGDDFLDKELLWGHLHPTDQVIIHFRMIDHKFKLPDDAPPMGDKPAQHEHPPMNMSVHHEI